MINHLVRANLMACNAKLTKILLLSMINARFGHKNTAGVFSIRLITIVFWVMRNI